ncbi:NAD(P)/FAD-dependent oxidoreductase [Aestuariirhabdus litorea]|uniref:FAD-dependent oxidoreductase n=1 Tax=Aestuariirhabdus litorea TaxID=2528527 RepID=A0A3P3VJK4_9GAMM|nr:FAD-dependent oxidoreductase [Aestuariirhabdus litorea]RRJ82872.1 FAD-dependent oxidoreductase [Aestuariirhabdus litorea]RWW93031.1 FAD-dependent oxidoreductase [Endozoicomonadaceae bacterium GTF-13]
MTESHYDLVIVGAGPAGMAAAIDSARAGLRVALLDEQQTAGGQIYRRVGSPALRDRKILGPDYYYGEKLVDSFQRCSIDHIRGASVWEAEADQLCFSVDGGSHRLTFDALLLATGAQERPVPFPGWTAPGVMTCGSAQIMFKTSGLAPAVPVVIAGSGPLLLLVACQLVRAGVPVEAVLDTTPGSHYREALAELGGALRGWRYLLKGVRLLAELRQAGVPLIKNVRQLQALTGSDGQLERVEYSHRGRRYSRVCKTLLVHQGVVPNVQLSRSMGLEHFWSEQQQCWLPRCDLWGESSMAGIYIAGDGGGIGGALAAELQGRLSACAIIHRLGRINQGERDEQARGLRRQLDQQLAIRPFLDRLYRPAAEFLHPADETLVCRCEEVSAGEIRRIAGQGCAGPNQAKAFSRAGMGPCQGRLCGLTVSQLIAEVHQLPIEEVGYYRVRAPIKPVTLGELATMAPQSSHHGAGEVAEK